MISPRLRTVSVISLCVLGVLTILNIVVLLETGNSVKKGTVKFLLCMIVEKFHCTCTELFNHVYDNAEVRIPTRRNYSEWWDRTNLVESALKADQAYWKLEHLLCMFFFSLVDASSVLNSLSYAEDTGWKFIETEKHKGRLDYWTVPIYCCTFMANASRCLFIECEVKYYKLNSQFLLDRGVMQINIILDLTNPSVCSIL